MGSDQNTWPYLKQIKVFMELEKSGQSLFQLGKMIRARLSDHPHLEWLDQRLFLRPMQEVQTSKPVNPDPIHNITRVTSVEVQNNILPTMLESESSKSDLSKRSLSILQYDIQNLSGKDNSPTDCILLTYCNLN